MGTVIASDAKARAAGWIGGRGVALLGALVAALALLALARDAGGLRPTGLAATALQLYDAATGAAFDQLDLAIWSELLKFNKSNGQALSLDPFWRHAFVLGALLAVGDAARLARRGATTAALIHLPFGLALAALASVGLGVAAAAPPGPIPHYLAAALPLAALFAYVSLSLAWSVRAAPEAAARGFHASALVFVLGLAAAAAAMLLGRAGLRYPGVTMLAAISLFICLVLALLAAAGARRRAPLARACAAAAAALAALLLATALATAHRAPEAVAAMAAAFSAE